MQLQELLQLDEEIKEDIQRLESQLKRQNPPRTVAFNCLAVSVGLAEQLEFAIHVAFDHYADQRVIIHIGNLGKEDYVGTEDEEDDGWLWKDRAIENLAADLPYLTATEGLGYHAWLSFAGSIIDPTIRYSIPSDEPNSNSVPLYISRDGTFHPPGLRPRYKSLREFTFTDFDEIRLLPLP